MVAIYKYLHVHFHLLKLPTVARLHPYLLHLIKQDERCAAVWMARAKANVAPSKVHDHSHRTDARLNTTARSYTETPKHRDHRYRDTHRSKSRQRYIQAHQTTQTLPLRYYKRSIVPPVHSTDESAHRDIDTLTHRYACRPAWVRGAPPRLLSTEASANVEDAKALEVRVSFYRLPFCYVKCLCLCQLIHPLCASLIDVPPPH